MQHIMIAQLAGIAMAMAPLMQRVLLPVDFSWQVYCSN